MENNDLSFYIEHSKIRTARKKRQNYLEDYYKKLFHLEKRKRKLWKLERELPPVPLEQPYQKGWVRYFVLRDDVKRSPQAEFFTQFLTKINTEVYSNNKKFYFKRKGKTTKVKYTYDQKLKSFYESDWKRSTNPLTDKEKEYFRPSLVWNQENNETYLKYAFTEPWRYVLRVRPYYVTHRKGLDPNLESETREIENYLDRKHLRSIIYNRVYGKKDTWSDRRGKPDPDSLKNRTFASIIEEYEGTLDLLDEEVILKN